MASALRARGGLAELPLRLLSAPPPTSETKAVRLFHFALYIWNLDSLKAAFLGPSQNVQMNALSQG